MIYYPTSNVGIGTNNPISDLHIYNEVINNSKLTIQNNSIGETANTITTTSGPFVTAQSIIDSIDKYMIFTSGTSAFTVPSDGIECDILMIGGGGGCKNGSGGGGAGACIVAIGQIFAGYATVTVSVATGGISNSEATGGDSIITVSLIERYRAKGGGAGSVGNAGGCGGGSRFNEDTNGNPGGDTVSTNIVTLPNGTIISSGPTIQSTYAVLGNAGGSNMVVASGAFGPLWSAAGGGGIGGPGVSRNITSDPPGYGGPGLDRVTINGITYNFKKYFTNNTTFGHNNNGFIGGGGGGAYGDESVDNNLSIGGQGGGGAGNPNGNPTGINAIGAANTGSGGGSWKNSSSLGGTGGSGIIIIRYRKKAATISSTIELIRGSTNDDTNIDYKMGNYEGSFKIISSLLGTDTDRLVINQPGNMTFSGSINATSYLLNNVNILTNISNTSNYVLSTSNILVNRIREEVGFGSNYTLRLSDNQSNYVLSTSNILVNHIREEVGFGSNYTLRLSDNTSNYVARINTALGLADSALGVRVDNTSNYVARINTALSSTTGQTTILSTAGQLIIGNGNGQTTTTTALTYTASQGLIIYAPVSSSGNDYLNIGYNSTNGIRFKERFIATDNVAVDLIQKVANVDKTASLTFHNGNVGIGTAALQSGYKLHVYGNMLVVGTISSTDDISAFFNISDDRLKIRIANINEPLKIIDKLNGFYYKVNELANSYGIINTETEIGLSAQEVQKVLPEVVKLAPFDIIKDINGNKISKSGENYLTISYEKLVPVFVEAIKELQKENKDLKQKYEYILEEIALIKKIINI